MRKSGIKSGSKDILHCGILNNSSCPADDGLSKHPFT